MLGSLSLDTYSWTFVCFPFSVVTVFALYSKIIRQGFNVNSDTRSLLV